MKKLITFLGLCASILVSAQTPFPLNEDFNSIGQPGDDWRQVLGPVGNAGEHNGQLCFNQTGNYIDNQYYSFEGDTVDLQLWTEVEMVFSVQQNLRNGDGLFIYYLDRTDSNWYGRDISGAQGVYTQNVPTTAMLFSIDLNTYKWYRKVSQAKGGKQGKTFILHPHLIYAYCINQIVKNTLKNLIICL